MVPEPESFATNTSRWVILLCVLLQVSACGDEPVEQAALCQCPEVETVPASVRYSSSDNIYSRSALQPVTPPNQMYMMPQQQGFPADSAQQGWGLQSQRMPAAAPAWGAGQQTFKAPQNAAFQNQQYQQHQPYQQSTAASPWAIPDQSAAVQQFQSVQQRPWGPPAGPVYGNLSPGVKDRPSQQPQQYQWGAPVGGGYYERGAGPGATQGTGYPGYAR